jgi:hydrogenase maturation protease
MDHVRQIAQAVLYEGYLLWPYRASSLKNRHRWTIGGVHPEAYGRAHDGNPWRMRTECLVEAEPGDTVDVRVRFLHVVTREPHDGGPAHGARPAPGEEAQERELSLPGLILDELPHHPARTTIDIPAGHRGDAQACADERRAEPDGTRADPDGTRADPDGLPVEPVAHAWEALCGRIEVAARRLRPGLFRITAEVVNTTPWPGGTRADAMRRALVSAHIVLHSPAARFVSLMDPPDGLREHAAGCRNEGVWPVLAGPEGDRHTVLAAPIILYDHPRIAPESPGDLFDATEIDQLLTLSVLALSDQEQQEIRDGDPRGREILDRCAALTQDDLMRLHGLMRRTEPTA